MNEFEIKEMVDYLINKYKFKSASSISTACDLYQEARLVVPLAMKTWDRNREAALKTHVINCVKNRFIDLIRKDVTYNKYSTEYASFNEMNESIPEDPIEAFEFDLTMKAILDSSDFSVYRLYYVYGHTIREIVTLLQSNNTKVQSCLHRICHQYSSLEKSLQKISTQRRLTADFLSISDPQ